MAEPPAKRCKTTANGDTETTPSTSSQAATPTSSPASSHTSAASPSPQKYKADDLVTLLVGSEEQEKFVVHGYRLIETSEFFRAALQKEWKEGQTRIIELPEEDTEDTTNYLNFVFDGTLPTHAITNGNEIRDTGSSVYYTLCYLYALGERLLDAKLRNAVIKEFVRLSEWPDDEGYYYCPSWGVTAAAYETTLAGSPLRRFLVDVLVTSGLLEWLSKSSIDLEDNSELLADVVKEFTRKAEEGQNPGAFRDKELSAEKYFV